MSRITGLSYSKRCGNRYLAVADLVAITPKRMMLTRINVPKQYRGQGIASELLKELLKDADAEGVSIELAVSASDGLSEDELYKWYRRHGFKSEPCRAILVREPKVQ